MDLSIFNQSLCQWTLASAIGLSTLSGFAFAEISQAPQETIIAHKDGDHKGKNNHRGDWHKQGKDHNWRHQKHDWRHQHHRWDPAWYGGGWGWGYPSYYYYPGPYYYDRFYYPNYSRYPNSYYYEDDSNGNEIIFHIN